MKVMVKFLIGIAVSGLIVILVFKAVDNNRLKKTDVQPSVQESTSQNEQKQFPPAPEFNSPPLSPITKNKVNLPVTFTPQAPLAVWNERDEESCEEAAVLMAAQYFGKLNLKTSNGNLDPAQVDAELNNIIEWEKQYLGEWKSTNATQTAKIAVEYFGLKAEAKKWNSEEAKKNLSQGKLIIIPAAGRNLGNPYYKRPGPLFHMLLVRGYNGDYFITNDPGTKRGDGYQYNASTLNTAVQDWPIESEDGQKAKSKQPKMIIIEK